MRWLLVLVIIAALGWYYYSHVMQPAPPSQPEPVAEATPAPVHVKQFAPDGVYYLLQRISITSDDGVLGIDAGTRVTVVKDNGPSLMVTDGHAQFEVTKAQLTNDMDVVSDVLKKSQSADAAEAAYARRQEDHTLKTQLAETAEAIKEQKEDQKPPTPAPTVAPPAPTPPSTDPLDRPAFHN